MLDVKRLILLRDLAEHGTVTAVAELNQVTPSAVSQQLRALEAESGAELLIREGRTVRLTAAGVALAAQCEHVLAALERAHGAVRALDDQISGNIVIGCFTSALRGVATSLAATIQSRHPRLRPCILEAEPEESLSLLKRRDLDLAIIYRYEQLGTPLPAGVTLYPLFNDPLMVAVPNALRGAVERGGIAVLRDQAWVATPGPSACREILFHTCRSTGFTPAVEHSYRDLHAALSLISIGLGVMILPSLLCVDPPPGTALLPLPGRGRVIEAAVRSGTDAHPLVAAALSALQPTAPGVPA
ncbi:LysR family transcriptional regulator [Nonomuraea sp. NBC_00507]|uniref:LysR family transcriptional regulator n=1 Tax=Nonomuraea sp. NBC_00507 TaxID=2976002 RepID=UPI002E1918FA